MVAFVAWSPHKHHETTCHHFLTKPHSANTLLKNYYKLLFLVDKHCRSLSRGAQPAARYRVLEGKCRAGQHAKSNETVLKEM
jgi:hypothetical protein